MLKEAVPPRPQEARPPSPKEEAVPPRVKATAVPPRPQEARPPSPEEEAVPPRVMAAAVPPKSRGGSGTRRVTLQELYQLESTEEERPTPKVLEEVRAADIRQLVNVRRKRR